MATEMAVFSGQSIGRLITDDNDDDDGDVIVSKKKLVNSLSILRFSSSFLFYSGE